ncbi:hypothetical protein XAXN_03750 [Xanthomonas axonopodis]|uniref:Uncharacterized protein n=2 Tax=Xanthomonas axonopodis TaxID=53413 RepID=A0A0P6VTW3_9XANT|nr:hypothetical protein [Xanthomonas axonopodis]KPL50067.1 hypothetical protein XAXN_03750 [Xanthomonas axonopodis]
MDPRSDALAGHSAGTQRPPLVRRRLPPDRARRAGGDRLGACAYRGRNPEARALALVATLTLGGIVGM